jgi:hypothetical protein
MGFFSSDFYNTIKNERLEGILQSAFTYEQGRGAMVVRACNLIITEHFLVIRYDPSINVASGIFGFATINNFKSNIDNSRVVPGSKKIVADLAIDPKSISQAVPLENIELVSVLCFTVDGGWLEDHKVEVGLVHFKINGKFLGIRENIIFSQSQYENVIKLFEQTQLSSKMGCICLA